MAALDDRCRALTEVLPRPAVFTHLTGAGLRGWALPDRVHLDLPLIASAGAPAPHLDRRGVYIRRCRLRPCVRTDWEGLPVVSAPQLVRELAEDLSLIDLVVAIDSALHLGQLTSADLVGCVRRRRRGCRVLSRAMTLVDGRCESGYETLLRLIHLLSGLNDIEPQHLLTDPAGRPIARADLWLRGTRRLHEYDGADHLTSRQQHKDRRRDNDLARHHYDRRGYTRPDITLHAGRIVRDAEDAFGLDHDPSRVQGWLNEFRRSSYSAAGRMRLQRRLARFRRDLPPRSVRRVAQE